LTEPLGIDAGALAWAVTHYASHQPCPVSVVPEPAGPVSIRSFIARQLAASVKTRQGICSDTTSC